MENPSTYPIDLMARYFAGEANPDEISILEAWVKENPENRKLFQEYSKAWNLSELEILGKKTNLDDEWNAFEGMISAETKPEPKVLSIQTQNQKTSGFNWLRVAAVLLVLLVSGSMLYYYLSGPEKVVVTAEVGTLVQKLEDGSIITLNKGARLEYPKHFSGKREVNLQGEAYFEVAHDASKPFIVSGKDANIEVLGTKFNVNTESGNGAVSVVLTSGRVSVYFDDKPKDTLILHPGELAILDSGKHSISREVNTDVNYMGWKTRHLVFENRRLDEVLAYLSNVYHTSVRLGNPDAASCMITATFDGQELNSVLNVIGSTLNLKVNKEGDAFLLSGTACK